MMAADSETFVQSAPQSQLFENSFSSSTSSSSSFSFSSSSSSVFFSRGNLLFVEERFNEAIECYTQAITSQPSEISFRLSRAAALLKVGRHREALEDCDFVLTTAEKCQSRQLPPLSYLRKGEALFGLGKYNEAKQTFLEGQIADTTFSNAKYIPWGRWIRKSDVEISGSIHPLLTSPPDTQSRNDKPIAATDVTPLVKPAPSVRHDWSQNDGSVYITFYVKGLKSDDCQVEFTERSFRATLHLPKRKGHWLSLTTADLPLSVDTSTNSSTTTYPSSSKTHRDWTKVDKECEEELKQDAKNETGDAALNSLFKEIYSKGNEDTRKAMIKSFQTSGGTVLSTNWDEVHKKDYEKEMTAPEGQEVRQW